MAKAKAQEVASEGSNPSQGGYGKRSVWQWVVIYIGLAALVYGVIYYVVRGSRTQPGGSEKSSQSLY